MTEQNAEYVLSLLIERLAAALDDAGFSFVKSMAGVQYDSTDLAEVLADRFIYMGTWKADDDAPADEQVRLHGAPIYALVPAHTDGSDG